MLDHRRGMFGIENGFERYASGTLLGFSIILTSLSRCICTRRTIIYARARAYARVLYNRLGVTRDSA